MITSTGVYQDLKASTEYNVVLMSDKKESLLLVLKNGYIISAYKKQIDSAACYHDKFAKEIYDKITVHMRLCTSKNCSSSPFELGVAQRHMFERSNTSYTIDRFNECIAGCEIASEAYYIYLQYSPQHIPIPENINWTPLTVPRAKKSNKSLAEEFGSNNESLDDVVVRSLAEIGLEKDITWLDKKQYYVVNDDETAEKIISLIEQYVQTRNGPVAYDVETSGLLINMFGKIGSKEKAQIEEINRQKVANGETPYRVDTLTGLILTIQPNVSYYFPVRNRKFKNVYEAEDKGQLSRTTKQTIAWIKSQYKYGVYKDRTDDMANWVRSHDDSEFTSDIILMERLRWLLTHANIVAHGGIFEWKVTWLYNIDLNLSDDTMVLHKLIYKFTDMSRGNLGERSDLKYLTYKHFGVSQLELSDFFTDYKEDDSGIISSTSKRKKKKGSKIDFSYMDYDGTKAYAPADGDFTLQLFLMFKQDLLKNYSKMLYIYQVEIIVSCAIAYMEFYGHKIDEEKIEQTKNEQITQKLILEADFRKLVDYSSQIENDLNEKLKDTVNKLSSIFKSLSNSELSDEEIKALKEQRDELINTRIDLANQLRDAIGQNERVVNMASPAQMAQLFFVERKIPFKEDEKPSVGKKVLKEYTQMKNPDGKPKYPEIELYRKWKDLDTLLTKFFDNLPDYMYPGGFIFSSYGQISTATGRMSCSKPNAQQYPKSISSIVVPRENCVMCDADFSQIEYRTLVALAKENVLIEKFKDPDTDYHTMMASLMYGVDYALVTPKMRGDAKSFNFGIPYGMGFASLAILLTGNRSKKSIEEAKEKYELYFKDQPNVRRYFKEVKEKAKFNEMTETLWGRFRKYSFVDKDGKYSQKIEGRALRQAGNAVIQGTAADIFKIAVARTFLFIRNNNLFGKFYITNMIHDEQLTEIDVSQLNAQAILKNLVECMELKLEGFPPLFVGAGVGTAWAKAKGKMAEIHPDLAEQFIEEAKDMSLYVDSPQNPKDVLKYFDNRVEQFRIEKIKKYLVDEKNWGQAIHPVIGNLLSLQFDFGVTDEFKAKYTEQNGYTKDEIAEALKGIGTEQIKRFIEKYQLDVDYKHFDLTSDLKEEEEVEEGYDEADEYDEDGTPIEFEEESQFVLLDETNEVYGIDIRDVIKEFGIIVSKKRKICGINTSIMSFNAKDDLSEYLSSHLCDKEEPDAMEVVYLKDNNTILNTEVYVKGVTSKNLEKILGKR